jgi:hypothetical protein
MMVAASLLSGCSSEGLVGVTVVTSGSHEAGSARLLGDVVVLGGTLSLDAGSTVAGSAHVLGGGIDIAGEVAGDVTVISGRLRLEPSALISGDVSISAGGVLDMADGARVMGSLAEGVSVGVGVDPGPFDPVSFLLRFLVLTVAIQGVRQLAPRRTGAVAGWARGLPAASIAYGFLLGLVGLSLAVFMAFTLILAPVALILLLVMGLAGLLGLAGIATAIDDQLVRRRGWRAGYGSVACAATLNVAPLVPVIGLLATLLVATAALGAVGLSVQRRDVRGAVPPSDLSEGPALT